MGSNKTIGTGGLGRWARPGVHLARRQPQRGQDGAGGAVGQEFRLPLREDMQVNGFESLETYAAKVCGLCLALEPGILKSTTNTAW